MNELFAFKSLELLTALGILYSAYRIDGSISSGAWEKLSLAAIVIAVKSAAEIFLLWKGLPLGVVTGTFAPSMAVLLSGAGLSFVDSYGEFGRIKAHHFVGFVTGIVGGTVAISLLAPNSSINSLYYLVTPVLLVPAIYCFYFMQEMGERAVFRSMLASATLFFTASAMNIYLATVCRCSPVYGFALPFSLPEVRILEFLAASAPVLHMTGVLFLGFAVYLFHHGVFREVDVDTASEDSSRELVSETVENIGAIVGRPVAERMALKALNERFDNEEEKARDAAEGEELDEVKDVLEEALGDSIGPVAERKISEIYGEKKGEE